MRIDLQDLARRIDEAGDIGDVVALAALADECVKAVVVASPADKVQLYYFEANAHDGIRHALDKVDQNHQWGWEQPDGFSAALALRRAISEDAFAGLEPFWKARIYTNLANALSAIGRPVEAIEAWTNALGQVPNFAMARGNRGFGTKHYALGLYDRGHRYILLALAQRDMTAAIAAGQMWDSGEHPEAVRVFEREADEIARGMDVNSVLADFEARVDHSLGKSRLEQEYRRWALDNRLFLNPLNDAGTWPIAAHDVFHLPDHTYEIDNGPRFVRYYDILKSEFIGARTLCFEGIIKPASYADEHVLHFDSFDGPVYGMRAEKLRAAFRSAYSIFDKIASFVNDYFKLELAPRDVWFRRVFYESVGKEQAIIRAKFAQSKNWPLRGLFALSRDLFDPDFKTSAAPDARRLDELRNAIEHRFLGLVERREGSSGKEPMTLESMPDFERKVVRMLKLARAALIYLSLAVRREEVLRKEAKTEGDKVVGSVVGVPLRRGP